VPKRQVKRRVPMVLPVHQAKSSVRNFMRDDRAASIGRADYGGRPKVCPDGTPRRRAVVPVLFLYRGYGRGGS
jgi:hypothetical protein